jgi:hypothetical protein
MDSYEPPTATALAVSKASLMLYIRFKCRVSDIFMDQASLESV